MVKQGTGVRTKVNRLAGVACSLALVWGATPAMAQSSKAKTVTRATPHGSVIIKRDDYGVPNIYADDTYSLFYGWGYAVAEDRLFQLESTRRSSQGTAAEVFGPDYLEKDRLTLTNYDPQSLKPQLAALTGEHRIALDGMVAGINARIREVLANQDKLLPKQFNDFGFKPSEWTDQDVVMCWVGMLLFRFSDYTSQISNVTMLEELKAKHGDAEALKIFRTLRWRDDPSAPLTVKPEDQAAGRSKVAAGMNLPTGRQIKPISIDRGDQEAADSIVLWGGTGPDKTPHASNTWLVNGGKLSDAQAMLVSGPQVGDQVPSMIWEASLHGAGIDVTGLTYPGLLYFHYGTNGDIAWGRTALAGSVIDTYQEQLNPKNPREYRFNGQWRVMDKRRVIIAVKGQASQSFDLYSTVHGPVVLTDEKNNIAYSKRRAWAGQEISTILAYYDEMKARNYKQWSDAIARKSNNQSQYYADKDGNIAYIQAGRYPLRPKDHEIQLPTIGDGSHEWLGFQPTSQNVRVLNPQSGYIANWNNRPAKEVLNTDTLLWSKLDHVDAITKQLDAQPSLTAQQVWDVNRNASHEQEQQQYFVPLIAAAIQDEPARSPIRAIGEAITRWNGQQRDEIKSGFYDSPGPAAFYGWLQVAMTRLFEKDIPAKYLRGCAGGGQSLNCGTAFQPLSGKVLYYALSEGKGGVVPAFDFLHGTKASDFIRSTLAEAARTLADSYGSSDPQTWLLKTSPKVWSTLSPMEVPWSSPDEKIVYPTDQKRGTMNTMYVFRNGKVTMCGAVPPGQSGFIGPDGKIDPHYNDQLQLYTSFSCKRRWVTKAEVDDHTVTEKTLQF